MSTVSNFCKTVAALIKGDDAALIAIKIEKKAKAAFKQQITALDANILDLQERVDDAQEAFRLAIHVTEPIQDTKAYLENIVRAREALVVAQEELAVAQNSLDFFTELSETTFK